MRRWITFLGAFAMVLAEPVTAARTAKESLPQPSQPKAPIDSLSMTYLRMTQTPPDLGHPLTQAQPPEAGFEGARLGIEDDNTTGQFTHQHFSIEKREASTPEAVIELFRQRFEQGDRVFLLDLPGETTLAIARLAMARSALLLDVSSSEDRLRGIACEPNLFFIMPSDGMRSDALAQFLAKKRWQHWFLATGPEPADERAAEALRKSAKKFGAKLVEDKRWTYHFEDRRTPEAEVPTFTQGRDYDFVLIADSQRRFADLFAFRTWLPRPIAGSSGLSAAAWHSAHEAWGALQLQTRFTGKFGRPMAEKDYGSWLATRIIAEAGTRGHSLSVNGLQKEILSESFSIAGFKGVPLSFRSWDHQLRQPLLLAGVHSVVGVAPMEGYLHPNNTLDTLGTDLAESDCKDLVRRTQTAFETSN